MLPDELPMGVEREWIRTEMYKKALLYIDNMEKTVKVCKEGESHFFFLLSQSQSKFSRISDTLVTRYAALRDGIVPTQTGGKWGSICEVANSMYLVEQVDPQELIPCKANPYNFACRICPAFAHDGICKHVLAVTHICMSMEPEGVPRNAWCNVRYMSREVDEGAGKRGRPHLVRSALECQPRSPRTPPAAADTHRRRRGPGGGRAAAEARQEEEDAVDYSQIW